MPLNAAELLHHCVVHAHAAHILPVKVRTIWVCVTALLYQ
jgi:hypothetical protein